MGTRLEEQQALMTVLPRGVWMGWRFLHVEGRGGDKVGGAVGIVDGVTMGCVDGMHFFFVCRVEG